MHLKQAASLIVLALATVGTAFGAWGQEKFPSRPIEMVIPTAAGGGTDIAFRKLAELVEPILGQKVVIVNKTGGGGYVGMASIIQAKADGYTIGGLWNAPLTMSPHMLPAPYAPNDYEAVTLSTWAPTVLCVKTEFPAKDGKEFIEHLRQNPDKFTYGNDGVGGTLHLAAERIFMKLGVKARAVPFNGAGETLKAFLGDHVNIYGGSIAPVQPYLKDKSAKCLIVSAPERNAGVPGASSLTDLGIPEESTVLWRGVIAPKGLPADRLAALQKAFADAAKSDAFKAFMESRGEEAKGSSSGDFRQLIDTEYVSISKVMGAIGLTKK
jgi:tripartite-type tricarboxylate transporter receptor subunit TctC